jgi:hypothetical protein
MNKQSLTKWIGAVALLTATAPALAAHDFNDARVSQRQHELERRIEQGWRSGELTRSEYRRLHRALREVDRAEHYYSSDGGLSPRERRALHAQLDQVARQVYRDRHDVERRGGLYNEDYHAGRRY